MRICLPQSSFYILASFYRLIPSWSFFVDTARQAFDESIWVNAHELKKTQSKQQLLQSLKETFPYHRDGISLLAGSIDRPMHSRNEDIICNSPTRGSACGKTRHDIHITHLSISGRYRRCLRQNGTANRPGMSVSVQPANELRNGRCGLP